MKAKEYAENRIAELMSDHGDDRTERVFSAEDVVQELRWVLDKIYLPRLYLLLYIVGGIPEIEEIYADWNKAHKRLIEISENDNLHVIEKAWETETSPDVSAGVPGFAHYTDLEEKNDLILKMAPVNWEHN